MAYKLYLDKSEEFICEVAVKNASLKDAFSRMIIESDGMSFMFEGQLKDGKCTVPIKKLKGLLDENSTGNMFLEIIVEDTYFSPWKDTFIIEQHTGVKVKVQEQKKSSKPVIEVKAINNFQNTLSDPSKDIIFICERVGINKKNLIIKKNDFKLLLKEYFKENPEFLAGSKLYIKEVTIALK